MKLVPRPLVFAPLLKFIEAPQHRPGFVDQPAQFIKHGLEDLRAPDVADGVGDLGDLVEVVADPRKFLREPGEVMQEYRLDCAVPLDHDLRRQGGVADIIGLGFTGVAGQLLDAVQLVRP